MVKLYTGNIGAIAEPGDFAGYFAAVDKGRQEKVMRYRSREDQKRSLLAGYLLQTAVKRELGLPEEAPPLPFEYAYGEQGKPLLENYPAIHFNLSHSGCYAICAVSEHPVGADIQQIKMTGEGVAERFFSGKDAKLLQHMEEGQREQMFCRLWAIKEACMKWSGEGLAMGIQRLTTVREQRRITIEAEAGQAGREASYVLYEDLAGYVAAVCCEEPFEIAVIRR